MRQNSFSLRDLKRNLSSYAILSIVFLLSSCHKISDKTCDIVPLYEEAKDITKYKWHPGGWMGAINSISLNDTCTENPYQGETCIKISYNTINSKKWAGIYWLANDSWSGPGINVYEEYNLKNDCNYKLTFYCRGDSGIESAQFKVGGVMDGDDSIYPTVEMAWLSLTTEWTKYEIDLEGKNLSNLVGGFCVVIDNTHNETIEIVTLFLDFILYESY